MTERTMRTRTKIVCTMGPAVNSLETMIQLIEGGMDVARLNFSHGTYEGHGETARLLKKARKECERPLAIMIDTKGPEIRLGNILGSGVLVSPGMRLTLTSEVVEGTEESITVRPAAVLEFLTPGTSVLIDNGYVQAKVVEVVPNGVVIEFENAGTLTSSKGINIPSIKVPLPSLTRKDIDDIRFACQEGFDLIAASFIRNADNVLEIKHLLHELGREDMLVLAKIESMEGVQNFDSILQVADGIMVARGDLGVEVPLAQVPSLQKMMIRKCNLAGKPVVTATQMLESMMNNPRPTRAEVSDVANAIYDGTSAVMLSGETAVGHYALQTVQTMQSIIAEAERDFDYRSYFENHAKMTYNDIPSALTLASVKTAYSVGAKALFTPTLSGSTARLLSRLRPSMPIIALAPTISAYHQLALSWGVIPILCEEKCSTIEDSFAYLTKSCLQSGLVSYGDLVVLTAGWPFWVSGTTNTIRVDSIGDVLARGTSGIGEMVHGNVVFVPVATSIAPRGARGCIVVLSTYDESFNKIIDMSAGVILQNCIEDSVSQVLLEEECLRLKKTLITGVDGAYRSLRENQLVTMDPKRAIIYKGILS
jgi:pyruvate kinase